MRSGRSGLRTTAGGGVPSHVLAERADEEVVLLRRDGRHGADRAFRVRDQVLYVIHRAFDGYASLTRGSLDRVLTPPFWRRVARLEMI